MIFRLNRQTLASNQHHLSLYSCLTLDMGRKAALDIAEQGYGSCDGLHPSN